MKFSATYWAKTAISACFATIVFLYFSIIYPYHLQFHESLQMFMFTASYASDVIGVPGGLADYLSRFLVQFFYYPTLGAAIVALLLAGIQLCSSKLLINRSLMAYPLSLLPALALWWSLCDENSMISAVVAILLALCTAITLIGIGSKTVRFAVTCLSIPIFFFLLGSLYVITPLIVIIYEIKGSDKPVFKFIFAASVGVLCIISLYVAHEIFTYGMRHLIEGIQYHRFLYLTPVMAWIAAGISVVCPLLSLILPKNTKKASSERVITAIVTLVVAVAGYAGVAKGTDLAKEDVFAYKYLANDRQWQQIIDKTDKKTPDNPFTVACLNLALGMTGQLPDRMFTYFQNGTEGLFPHFVIDFTTPLPTSEVLYHLGMLNAAQRYVFEAQEAIPDFQKSASCYKRLAEINLINGNYNVAEKYLNALSHTLFYSDWADEARQIVATEGAVDKHWEYGALRKIRAKTDVFMGDDPVPALIYHINDNPENKIAVDYLIASYLLNCQLAEFYETLASCTFPTGYVLPRSYQEALALMWVMEHPSWEGLPWNLAPNIKQRMEWYLRDMKKKMPAEYMKATYGDTYWQYYFSKK